MRRLRSLLAALRAPRRRPAAAAGRPVTLPRTLPAPPGAPRISPPRVCARRLTVTEKVKRYYELAEMPMLIYMWDHRWERA